MDFHIQELGFQKVHHDQCLLLLYKSEKEWIRCGWHVDDGAFTQKGEGLWMCYLSALRAKYVYSLAPLHHFCGTNYHIDYERGVVRMEQTALIEKALRDLSLDGDSFRGARFPATSDPQPSKDDIPSEVEEGVASYPMAKSLGYATYIHQCARPDIGQALKVGSKFAKKFGKAQVDWVNHIWRYLKATKQKGLIFRRVANGLRKTMQIFTDASHAGDPDTRRSISGLVIKLGGNTIFWKSLFQSIVSHSSTESEIMSIDKGATTGQLAKWVCLAMGYAPMMPIPIFIDNTSAIMLASNPIQTGRNLHMHARYFYVRDMVAVGEYTLMHLPTNDMVSDLLVTFKGGPNHTRLCALLMGCAYLARSEKTWEWRVEYLD